MKISGPRGALPDPAPQSPRTGQWMLGGKIRELSASVNEPTTDKDTARNPPEVGS